MLGGADNANGKRVRVITYFFLLHRFSLYRLLASTAVFHKCFCCLHSYVTLEIDESKKDEVIRLLQEIPEVACEVVSVRRIQSGNG